MEDRSAELNEPAAAGTLNGLVGWALTPGHAGNEVQCLGVLEALGIDPVVKRASPGIPWRWLAPHGPAAPDPDIAPPWPDLLVASGRRAIPHARMIRQRSGGRTFVAILQDPRISPAGFDFVWVPQHDPLRGDNVLATLTSPHRLTRERLEREAARFAPDVAALPRPLVCVLVGGDSGAYRFGPDEAERLAADLGSFSERHGCGLLVAPSRRTGTLNISILKERLRDVPALVWDLEGDNPYFGFVGLAEAFIVTCESANMLGEAAYTGRPVYAYRLPGGNNRFRRLHDDMMAQGALKWFDGTLDRWTYPPLDATRQIAEALRGRLIEHRRRFRS